MIDKMIRCKNLESEKHIESLCEWFYKCPPQGKLKHWKDGRSAKETAKHWVHTIPQPFKDLLNHLKLTYAYCAPEFVSKFDSNGGNGRNHDLLLIAKNKNKENIVISIESKVDEPFGDTISKAINAAKAAKEKNKNSKAEERIAELRIALFGEINNNQLDLRYQLLTAVAGTVAEAKAKKSKSAYFIIQTFVSDELDQGKYLQNQNDLNHFLSVFTKSEKENIENNGLLGPYKIQKSTPFLLDDINLWIGKYEISI